MVSRGTIKESPMPGDLEEESLLTSESGSRYMTVETTEGRMPLLDAVRRNLPAAVTVAIVSLSLSIALGIASGAGPQAGLSTAVWGGIAGGLFASSHYNIIGPAGALAPLLSLHSYLNLYRTIPLRKLALVASSDSAREEEATVDTLRAQLTCLKFKTQQENAERARFANDPRFQLYIERLRMRMQAVPDGLGYYLDGVRLALFLCVSLSRDDDIVSTVVLALFCAGPTKPKPCSAAGVVTADTIHAPV